MKCWAEGRRRRREGVGKTSVNATHPKCHSRRQQAVIGVSALAAERQGLSSSPVGEMNEEERWRGHGKG